MIFLRLKLFHPLFDFMNADCRMNVGFFKDKFSNYAHYLFMYFTYLFSWNKIAKTNPDSNFRCNL